MRSRRRRLAVRVAFPVMWLALLLMAGLLSLLPATVAHGNVWQAPAPEPALVGP
jgi:hypothetical protein